MDPTPTAPALEPQAALEPLRQRIDALDAQIVQLLNERAKVVVDIGKVKRSGSEPIYAPDRERKVLDRVRKLNAEMGGPLPDRSLEAIWRELMSGSFALEKPLRIGYLGPPGSFSHLAARKKFGASVEYDDLTDIASVFDAVARGHIDLGLVPIENSGVGGIGETLDAFLGFQQVRVCAEVLIHVHMNLLANCQPDQIKRIYSKPEAFSQCRRWLSMQLPHAERVAVASTSKAAEMASKEAGSAAIGSSLAAEVFGVHMVFESIEDNAHNVTRFFVIAPQDSKPSGADKTALMFSTAHQAGALAQVLDVFRDAGLNLTHIDKRPSQRTAWEYYFFVDFEGHRADAKVGQAIAAAKAHCQHLAVLGSFPKARDVM